MNLKYDHLVGLHFNHGTRDCYEICRDFFRDNEIVDLPPHARPDGWWEQDGMNLYMDFYADYGFELFHGPMADLQPADVFMCAIKSRVANHAAIHVGDGRILHHFYGRLSEVCEYRGLWRNTTVAVLRHKSLKDYRPEPVLFGLPPHPGSVADAGAA